jgi:hypothetical protein
MQLIDHDRIGVNLDTRFCSWTFGFNWDAEGRGMDICIGPLMIELFWGRL